MSQFSELLYIAIHIGTCAVSLYLKMIHMMCLWTDSSLILIFVSQIAGQCFIYEPLFSQDEIEIVKELGCSLIQRNEVHFCRKMFGCHKVQCEAKK